MSWAGSELGRNVWVLGRRPHYQVDVHSGVAKSAPTAVTRDHAALDFTHGLLCYQINGKVFIHLQQEKKNPYRQGQNLVMS